MRTAILSILILCITFLYLPCQGQEKALDLSKFYGGKLTEDKKGLRLAQGYASLEGANNWSGYDALVFDTDAVPTEMPFLFASSTVSTRGFGRTRSVHHLPSAPSTSSILNLWIQSF
jgi:hypothetical protein